MSTEEPAEDEDEDLRYFVRIGQTDLDGTKAVGRALTGMDGIGRRAARIVAEEAEVDRHATLGRLEDDEIDRLVEKVENFDETVPDWLTNRRKDFYTGETTHVIGNDVDMSKRRDVNRMQMIRSYKGVRHERGQKVRGQRTKSTGRTEGTVGVSVEDIKEQMEEEEAEEADDEGDEEL